MFYNQVEIEKEKTYGGEKNQEKKKKKKKKRMDVIKFGKII